ncbi:inter-alpha-trypsin inhibitor heavy chain H6 isoform X2 [Seriola lalandi dorsalis]|uniref:inter-alpha-trypsin inhibitor heavy chain H5 n=1 Tax=Seriola aureovittata TaxID=2871759 RepID=UPI000C6FBED9|nr:inter-alpha-trypsin inhibitor heavy chain H6 isoform X2 [Seriola lalandi dorsalis]XP_056240293.1 inter-alpha-trypsin inhibitor heavy chain H5 [Seriola aureovittata]
MDMMNLKIHCFLVFFTFYVQEGLSGDYEARLGANILLQRIKRLSKPTKPVLKVTDYHVRCSVVSRYAVTTVQSSVWNQLPVIKEAAFEVDLPSSAFISNFTITSNGKVYVAQVKERAAARKIYDAAKKQGKTAGLVATKEREIEKFRVAVSVPSGARMSFSLTYEELLPRRLGRYELSLGLRPGQAVQNMTLDVGITERTGLSFIKVLPLKTTRLLSNTAKGDADPPPSTHVEQSAGCARVRYSPTVQQQSSVSSKGLDADFIIQYDVNLRDLIGDVQVYDGYFVHYFAPRGLPVVPKDVIFVIDVSGSMIGTKIKQTKQAMSTILGDLREGDHFNIITFSDKVHTWKKGRTVRATRQNVRDAKDFVKRIIAEGWTNINAALLSAAQLVNPPTPGSSKHLSSRRVPLVIFLTDGEATIGVTAGDTILSNAKKALGSASLFGLAFGDDADFLLLKRLALDNRGVARMVYEDADAALQLKGFYDEVASPLLSDIQLSYLDDQAFDITRSLFPNYFQGSELVVAGRIKAGVKDLKVSMSATDSKQRVKMENDVMLSHAKGNDTADSLDCSGGLEGISSFVHRLWAYFTIKELLLAKLNATDPATQRLLAEKATNLSLKYNFVTPVTSLVVVKPETDEAAQTPTTAKPTTAATITTTTTTTATTKIPAASAAKKPSTPSNPRPNKTKPDPPQPPPNTPQTKKGSSSTSMGKTVVSPSKKTTTTTTSPSSIKTAPAPLSGKKPTPSHNDSKPASPPPAGKISTSVLNALKTAPPPAPGKVSTPQAGAMKTTTPSMLTFTTTPPLSSVRTDPAPLPGRHLTPQPSTVRTAHPPVKVTEADNSSTSAPDVPQSGITTALPQELSSPLTSPTPAPAPAAEVNNTNAGVDTDLSIATLVSATFAPMPGVTDGPRLWEAAGLLDVSTSIQIQRKDIDLVKDYDATYDYDYDLSYDAWDDTADTGSFEPPSRLSTVRVFSSSVDGDPHFVVQLPKLHQNLCFTVDGRAKDVLRLLEDPDRGIIVDGQLIGAPSKHGVEDRPRTYFNRLTISTATGGSGGIMITISLDTVVVEGEGRDTLPINQQGLVMRQGVTVIVDNHRSCWIELAKDVRFLVLFHHYKQPSYLQMAHLGFYITDGRGLSASTQGLLGQFQHTDMSVTVVKDHVGGGAHRASKEGVLARGILRWGSDHMPVTLQDKTLKDSVRKRHMGKCWVVPKAEIQRLLGHPYDSYVVDRV